MIVLIAVVVMRGIIANSRVARKTGVEYPVLHHGIGEMRDATMPLRVFV